MQFALFCGKIVVHCHAGYGRTGVIIACYLIFNNSISANEAINYVRFRRYILELLLLLNRPGTFQTQIQIDTVFKFQKFVQPYKLVFAGS